MRQERRTEVNGEEIYVWLFVEENLIYGEKPEEEEEEIYILFFEID